MVRTVRMEVWVIRLIIEMMLVARCLNWDSWDWGWDGRSVR